MILMNEGGVMIWVLSVIASFFIVVVYRLIHDTTVGKMYADKKGMHDTFSSCSMSMAFLNHLANVRHEVSVRAIIRQKENEIHSSSEDIGWDVILYNPDNPKIYEKILYSPSQRFWKKYSYAMLVFYVLLMLSIINTQLSAPEGGLKMFIFLLAQLSPLPVLVWLYKRAHHDGRVEGFLNGYLAAQQEIYVFQHYKKNGAIDNLNIDNDNAAYDERQPYSHGVRLWE